jgi:SAM-dependent methyltransferase
MSDHRSVYGTTERRYWATAEGLRPDERTLVDRHLDPAAGTLEAGTGGGRVALELRRLGFDAVTAFDFVPGLIEDAKQRDPSGEINFDVQDATSLGYPDREFDQVVYFAQLISTIDGEADRRAGLNEAARVLRPGGTALFSFLCFEARERRPPYRALLAYLRILRWAGRADRPIQLTPRLKISGRPNPGFLADRGPYVYWFRLDEVERELSSAGLELLAIGTTRQVLADEMHGSAASLREEPLDEMLYAVCRRPG